MNDQEETILHPERIRSIRLAYEKTQTEFAAVLGVCLTTVHRWESGKSRPSRRDVRSLEILEKRIGR